MIALLYFFRKLVIHFFLHEKPGMMIKHAAFILLLLATSVLTSCNNDEDPVPVDRQRSYLHILGAADVDTFNITFDYFNTADVVIKDFYYRRNWPIQGYADLQAGGTPDEFGNNKLFVVGTRSSFVNVPIDTVMQPTDIVLAPDEQSTLCIADSMGTLVTLKIVDNISFPNDTSALVRFINLAPEQASAGLSSTDGSFIQSGVGFLQHTDFQPVPTGASVFEVSDTSGTVTSSLIYDLRPGKAYSIYLSGNGNGILDYFVH